MPKQKMRIEDADPELQKAFSKLPNLSLEKAWVRWLIAQYTRFFVKAQADPNVKFSREKLTNADIRIYQPRSQSSGAGLLWIHGGGMITGDAVANDPQCNRYVRELGLTVVSANYRLAPKHPYPAAIDDCFEAWSWFVENAPQFGVNPERIAIAGQSAGGGLAASLCHRIVDTGGPSPAAQILYYPMLDDRTALRDDLTQVEHILWNNKNNQFGWSSYLGRKAGLEDPSPKWAVPGRRINLYNLPPTWIGVGDLDLFLEEDRAYAAALRAAGVECEFLEVPRAPHGFDGLVPNAEVSLRFVDSLEAFLRTRLLR